MKGNCLLVFRKLQKYVFLGNTASKLLQKMSIFSSGDRYDAATDARKHTCRRWHDMAAGATTLHRIHVNLNLDRFVFGILLEQTNLLGNQFLHLLRVVVAPKLHHHLLDIQILDS